MDMIDAGADTAQLFLDVAIQQQRDQGTLHRYTGFCYNCGEAVEAPGCFCDVPCQEDWEKRQEIHRRTHASPSALGA